MVERASLTAFIADNTVVRPVALVPELSLHTADESTAIWQATERQLADAGVPPPFWAFAWAGGQALARHLLDHPELVTSRRVFDFAAGSGLVAIAAARAGARRVWANDIDPFACAAIAANARLNGLGEHLAVVDRDVTEAASGAPDRIDLITAGDICYERDMTTRVMAWLRAQAGTGVTVLIGDPGRDYLPRAALAPVATMVVPTMADLEDASTRTTTIWRVLP